jgi:hypothetical protein
VKDERAPRNVLLKKTYDTRNGGRQVEDMILLFYGSALIGFAGAIRTLPRAQTEGS